MTSARQCQISRVRCHPASSIRGKPSAFRSGKPSGEPSRSSARRFHQLPAEPRPDRQSPHSATGSKSYADAQAIEAALAVLLLRAVHSHAVHGRGMGLEGALPVLLRFRGDLAEAVRKGRRKELQAPMRNLAVKCRTRSTLRPAIPPYSIGARGRAGRTERLTLVRDLLECPPAKDRPAAAGDGLRRCTRRENRC